MIARAPSRRPAFGASLLLNAALLGVLCSIQPEVEVAKSLPPSRSISLSLTPPPAPLRVSLARPLPAAVPKMLLPDTAPVVLVAATPAPVPVTSTIQVPAYTPVPEPIVPPKARIVQTGSFADVETGSAVVRAVSRPAESATVFQRAEIAAPNANASPGVPIGAFGQTAAFRGVQILSKPEPEYTEEARRRQIEGEVWLEVLFAADGSAQIRRVLRTLGYGLDENAIRAAQRMRFRPATRDSGPVDQIATVRVGFQLAQ